MTNDGPRALNDERPRYMISVAAELVGMHPQTLRIYEQKGLVNPKRTAGNTRLYSDADVERLRLIQRLTSEWGLNLAGVERVLRMEDELERLRRRMERMEQEMRRASGRCGVDGQSGDLVRELRRETPCGGVAILLPRQQQRARCPGVSSLNADGAGIGHGLQIGQKFLRPDEIIARDGMFHADAQDAGPLLVQVRFGHRIFLLRQNGLCLVQFRIGQSMVMLIHRHNAMSARLPHPLAHGVGVFRGFAIGLIGFIKLLLAQPGHRGLLHVLRFYSVAGRFMDCLGILFPRPLLLAHDGVGLAQLFLRNIKGGINLQCRVVLRQRIIKAAGEPQHLAVRVMRVRLIWQKL